MSLTELPEWSTADNDEDIGTFDSSGAFMSVKVSFLVECNSVKGIREKSLKCIESMKVSSLYLV